MTTGERPLEQDVAALLELTEGHPLYLAEVVELGLERGNLLNAPLEHPHGGPRTRLAAAARDALVVSAWHRCSAADSSPRH